MMVAANIAYADVLGAAEAHPGTCFLKAVSLEGGSPFHPILPLFPDICVLCYFFFLITEVSHGNYG